MRHKQVKKAKWIFSTMVPLTILAFLLAVVSISSDHINFGYENFTLYDGVRIIILVNITL